MLAGVLPPRRRLRLEASSTRRVVKTRPRGHRPNPLLQALSELVVAIESVDHSVRCVARRRACSPVPKCTVSYGRNVKISPSQATL